MARMGGFTKHGREMHQKFKKEQRLQVEQGAVEFVQKALEMYTRDLEAKEDHKGGIYLVSQREDGIQVVATKYQFTVRIHKVQVY